MDSMALTSSTLDYSRAKLQSVKYHWIQLVVYGIIALSVFGSLAIGAYCTARGGNVDWAYKFGIFVKVSCQYKK